MFNPTCGHCIEMAISMRNNIELFKNNKILFLAGPQMMPYLNSFYNATNIDKTPQIIVGIDSAKTIDALYSFQSLPQINIYDKDKRLVKVFYGFTPLDSLKMYLP
jgi:thiol-disulfide isomerase/thioredoxin